MWEVGNKIISEDKYSKEQIGIIWKITDEAVHVKFGTNIENLTFQKFFFYPKHHMQSNILDIKQYN